MGTTLRISAAATSRAAGISAIEAAFGAVRELDGVLSTWRDDSEIARLNHAHTGTDVSLSPLLYGLLQDAARLSRLTGGAFDPSIGPLIDAWDLRGRGRIPDEATLNQARAAVGMRQFVFADALRTIRRRHSAAWLDTGAFGKGVALAHARDAVLSTGVSTATLNFGGQVLAMGPGPAKGDWTVPVAHPDRRNQPAAWLHLHDRSASTSSQSERFVTASGRRVGHVLDPRTGYPVPAWGSVTVIAEDPTVADAVSTALLVLGPEDGLKWARAREDVAVLFLISRGGRLERRWNPALEQFLVADSTLSRGA
jgi:FAD:protein FMN transferase